MNDPKLSPTELQKCCFKGCVQTGNPAKGYDFFACEACCLELDKQIRAGMTEEEYAIFDAYWQRRMDEDETW